MGTELYVCWSAVEGATMPDGATEVSASGSRHAAELYAKQLCGDPLGMHRCGTLPLRDPGARVYTARVDVFVSRPISRHEGGCLVFSYWQPERYIFDVVTSIEMLGQVM